MQFDHLRQKLHTITAKPVTPFAPNGQVDWDTYRRQVQEYLTRVRRICNDSDVEYHDLYTNEPYDKALVRLMSRRA